MNILELILLGISLSIDAFTLSLSIGTYNISKKKIFLFSTIVGIFHLLMPIIGINLGLRLSFKYHYFTNLIFLLIIMEMIINLKDNKIYFDFGIIKMLLYAFSVSIDSFLIGLVLDNLLGPIIFMILSFSFTLFGFILGRYSYQKLGNIAKHIGIILMVILMLIHFLSS